MMQSLNFTTFQLMGGLGNQLFQYTAAISYSRRTSRSVALDLSLCRKPYNSRSSLLTDLRLSSDIHLIPSRDRSRLAAKLSAIASHPRILHKLEHLTEDRYISSVLGYDPKVYDSSNSFIVGFFQSYKYLEDLPESFRNIGVSNITSWQADISRSVNEDTQVIHIRRGDYETLQDSFGLLSSTYYKNAIDIALSQFAPRNIVCFSDNISTARDLLASLKLDIQFIGKPSKEPDASSLYLMSQSGAIVIANSTFSWWAATLNRRKLVIAPENWFRSSTPPNDLIPPEWVLCASDWIAT
jgi:hypothetical protein